jgi:hypothetical protein
MQSPSAPVEGYPKLADYMGQYPEAAILHRISSLNAKNLLYLQAELTHLELKLYDLEAKDNRAEDSNRSFYARDWYWLENSATEGILNSGI